MTPRPLPHRRLCRRAGIANTVNAQLPISPTSPEGKAKSSLNALRTALTGRTVLLPTEDSAEAASRLLNEAKRAGIFQPAIAPVASPCSTSATPPSNETPPPGTVCKLPPDSNYPETPARYTNHGLASVASARLTADPRMKIHEYQAKAILAKYDVPVPRGEVAYTVEEAEAAAKSLGGSVVVKAQIHAGGRGKGGGVKVAKNAIEATEIAKKMLGMTLVTHQTGPEGRVVQRLLVEETLPIERELYLGIVLDRALGENVFMASKAGGMEIEEVAANTPELILRERLIPGQPLQPFQARKLAYGMGVPATSANSAAAAMVALSKAYEAIDGSLAEINPFILTKDGKVYALDAKVNLDDNALYRHKNLLELRDLNEEDPLEVEASRFGLNYIKLDGNIACMVNGAGLAMATMDIIKYAGGKPANFLDVGGGANAEQIKNAFRILLSDPSVKAVLINIFGGILRCDTLANGVISAARELDVKIPVVVRMEGTNVELGQKMLTESGLDFTVANGMKDAAEKVVRLAR